MRYLSEDLSLVPPLDSRLAVIRECTGCHLSPHLGKNPYCKQVVPGAGDLNSEVLFVMMTPGAQENEHGIPAIGQTGTMIKNWLRQLGFDPYKFFWANAIACALPPERTTNRARNKVDQRELDACHKNLSLIISYMPNLKLVVALGADALKAVVGKGTRLKDVTNNLLRFSWRPDSFDQEEKKLLAYALYHPSAIARKDEGYAKEQAEASYMWSLKFLQQIILNINDLEKLKPSGETVICETEEQAMAWADWHLRDNRIKAYVIDFETLESRAWYSQALCAAFAYFNPDKGCDEAFVVPFLQCIDLPKEKWFKSRLKKSLKRVEIKWEWVPWFKRPDFAQEFMNKIRPLFDVTVPLPEGREKVALGAYHTGFDRNCWLGSFGYVPCGSIKQITEPDDDSIMPYDFMACLRLCGSQNSMKLENILKIVMPLIADEKGVVNTLLSKPQIDATGFGLLARKLPEQYRREDVILWAQEYKHYLSSIQHKRGKKVKKELKSQCPLSAEQIHVVETYYSLEADGFLSDILLDRAGFDGKKEYGLWKIVNEILMSPSEVALFTFAREKSFDNLFLGEQWHEAIASLNEADMVEQI